MSRRQQRLLEVKISADGTSTAASPLSSSSSPLLPRRRQQPSNRGIGGSSSSSSNSKSVKQPQASSSALMAVAAASSVFDVITPQPAETIVRSSHSFSVIPSSQLNHDALTSNGNDNVDDGGKRLLNIGVDVLPIPVIGAGFIAVCIAVLIVSLYLHCRGADKRHISWLRSKPHSIAASVLIAPGKVQVVADNYEYTVSQEKHQAPPSMQSPEQNVPKSRSIRSIISFKGKRGTSHQSSQTTRLIEDGATGLLYTESTLEEITQHRQQHIQAKRITSKRLTDDSIEEELEIHGLSMKNMSEATDDQAIPESSSFLIASRKHHPSITSAQLDDIDASYWSYSGDQTNQLSSSLSPRNFNFASIDASKEPSEADHRLSVSANESTLSTPHEMRRFRLGQQHTHPSTESKISGASGGSTNHSATNLCVPSSHLLSSGRESPNLSRQQSLRGLHNNEPSSDLMPRGKTYTGLLSLTRLHSMMQSKFDEASQQAAPPPSHQHHRKWSQPPVHYPPSSNVGMLPNPLSHHQSVRVSPNATPSNRGVAVNSTKLLGMGRKFSKPLLSGGNTVANTEM